MAQQSVAMLTVPTTPGIPYYSQRTKLDGREFSLRFSWNASEERWYLAIADEDNELLRAGIKLVCNWPLLRFYKFDPRMPQGELVVHDISGNGAPPGLWELGPDRRCTLHYYALTEL